MAQGSTSLLCIAIKIYKKMDKKLYFTPELEIVELETMGMLATSLGGDNDDTVLNNGDDNGEGGENFDPNLF